MLAMLTTGPMRAHAAEDRVRTGFDHGDAGWLQSREIEGVLWTDPATGFPAPAVHHVQGETQGSMLLNRRDRWLAPIHAGVPVRLTVDVEVRRLNYDGAPVRRDLVLELRDHSKPPPGFPYASVWTVIGQLDARHTGPQRMGATIKDPNSAALPRGWGGYGAEDAQGRPRLPEGRTFADVLAHADEIAITTVKPGMLYGIFHEFDIVYDNLGVSKLAR